MAVSTERRRCTEIAMVSRFGKTGFKTGFKTGLGLFLLVGAAAPAGAATLAPPIHPPAQFRIDFPRQGVMPGTPRDIAPARDLGSDETVGQGNDLASQGTVRHKRRRHVH
jgi:hypothetical protein